ncbi:MAG TPA: family 1 glycosylhydrolase [Aeromicrobium sp.]|nr:family 1 glycosylhydrolase [Aeromicrobium sp.]
MRLIRWTLPALVFVLVPFVGPAQAAPAPSPLGSDFLWGVASSGFQAEGYSPDSNWRRYAESDQAADRIGNSVDFLHRYKSDIKLARKMGVEVYRVGVEWARIEPQPGVRSAEGIAFCDDLIASIVEAGMRPMITIDHWVYPGWEADLGGWKRAGMLQDWLSNAHFVVDRYAKYDPIWITINEPTAYFLRQLKIGALTPLDLPNFASQLVAAHKAAYAYIHSRQPGAMVSSNVAFIPGVEPVLDALFLTPMGDTLDFVGIDYYYSAGPTQARTLYSAIDQFWKADAAADGIYFALQYYAEKYPKLPLYIVENSLPIEDHKPRSDGYLREDHLRDIVYWLEKAKADGYNVIGYNYWSLTDNYEWGSYTPRFGLYTVDVKTDPTLTRQPTAAVDAYRRIIAGNGVPATYKPSRPPTFCSFVNGVSSCAQTLQNIGGLSLPPLG